MQPLNRSRSLTEGGILASIAIIFALISVYLPILGVVVNMIWPVPILLLGVRHGFKVSLMCLAVAGIVIAMLINPLQAVSVVLGFGFIGVTLGYAINQNWSPMKTMVVGTVASCLSKAAVLLVGFMVMGFNPLAMQLEVMGGAVDQAVEIYQKMGIPPTQIEQMREGLTKTVGLLKYIMPAGFFLASVLDTFINYWIAKKILARLGRQLPDFPPFTSWTNPAWMLWIYGASMLLVTFYHQTPDSMIYHIGTNLQIVSTLALLVQGLANIRYFVDKKGWPKFVRTIVIFLVFMNQLVSQIVILIGAFDLVFDYRKLGINNRKKS